MLYTPRNLESRKPDDVLFFSLEPIVRTLGLSLVELNVYHGKPRSKSAGSVQIRIVIYKEGIIGVEDCTRVHRTILPRLELAFPGQEISLEVSSPGIDRNIKDGSEFVHYVGRGVRCFRSDISDWTAGVLTFVDEKKIVLRLQGGEIELSFDIIAKAKLSGDV